MQEFASLKPENNLFIPLRMLSREWVGMEIRRGSYIRFYHWVPRNSDTSLHPRLAPLILKTSLCKDCLQYHFNKRIRLHEECIMLLIGYMRSLQKRQFDNRYVESNDEMNTDIYKT